MDKTGLMEAYEASQPRLGAMDFATFAHLVADFQVTPVRSGDEVVGALLVRGNEIHACVLPSARGKWLVKSVLRVLDRVIREHGEATTKVTTEAGRQFVAALGFVQDGDIYRSRKTWVSNRH